jgi:hypothetical protein
MKEVMKMKEKWLKVEHTIRYLGTEIDDNIELEYTLNELKNSIIALMGFKLSWDDNEVFYKNMKSQANEYIDKLEEKWFKSISTSLKNLRDFINSDL